MFHGKAHVAASPSFALKPVRSTQRSRYTYSAGIFVVGGGGGTQVSRTCRRNIGGRAKRPHLCAFKKENPNRARQNSNQYVSLELVHGLAR